MPKVVVVALSRRALSQTHVHTTTNQVQANWMSNKGIMNFEFILCMQRLSEQIHHVPMPDMRQLTLRSITPHLAAPCLVTDVLMLQSGPVTDALG